MGNTTVTDTLLCASCPHTQDEHYTDRIIMLGSRMGEIDTSRFGYCSVSDCNCTEFKFTTI